VRDVSNLHWYPDGCTTLVAYTSQSYYGMRCSAGARTAPSTGLPQQGTARFNDSDLSGFTVEVPGADNR
jgi:hypothetical protein